MKGYNFENIPIAYTKKYIEIENVNNKRPIILLDINQ